MIEKENIFYKRGRKLVNFESDFSVANISWTCFWWEKHFESFFFLFVAFKGMKEKTNLSEFAEAAGSLLLLLSCCRRLVVVAVLVAVVVVVAAVVVLPSSLLCCHVCYCCCCCC